MSRSYAVQRCGCWLTSLFIRCCVNANPFCISTERHRAGKMLLICSRKTIATDRTTLLPLNAVVGNWSALRACQITKGEK